MKLHYPNSDDEVLPWRHMFEAKRFSAVSMAVVSSSTAG